MQIPVVDIFAGPGGLGEGFSAFLPRENSKQSPFKIAISAEAESNASKTLRLRAFFRQFPIGDVPESYYNYVAGLVGKPWTEETRNQWEASGEEARQLTLGQPEHDEELHGRIRVVSGKGQPWILIGGPPCQAYSLVGRARNKGNVGYRAEEDNRHFLYTHYLKILREFRPAAFVMENVKGILSSRIGQELMFPRILDDLHQPGGKGGPRYRLISMVVPSRDDSTFPNGKDFVLKAEKLGVPQARHRVVLLGLLEDFELKSGKRLELQSEQFSVADVIGGLPPLRSGVTDSEVGCWPEFARRVLNDAERCATDIKTANRLRKAAKDLRKRDPGTGGRWVAATPSSTNVPPHLESWFLDPRLGGILNHEVREHMTADLMRYAFSSAFAQAHGRSPRGANEFPVELHPKHKNWSSGKFVDRFKAQLGDQPSSTITSHLSKDGHYFIHPDPRQLRSLSVREAARLQTFPDNYFFEGKRGHQFKQVGNAVPPWMARQIAAVVYSYLEP